MIRNVVCAVSGGVDSTVAALLLKAKNFNVTGVFMRNWDIADEKGICSVDKDAEDAEFVCRRIGIPFREVNFVKEYWNDVFCHWLEGYEKGTTPNPDILCNRYVKFGHFFSYARRHLGADAIATGHYACSTAGPYLENLEQCTNGVDLLESADMQKDQTLFLSQIPQVALQRTMFPIGPYKKSTVKDLASASGLDAIAKKTESYGVCFIGRRKFQDFMEQYVEPKPGNFVNYFTGEIVGNHKGVHYWTIGQRTHIGGLNQAYFVAERDVATQTLYVVPGTDHSMLFSRYIATSKPHWINGCPVGLRPGIPFDCWFRCQHSYPLSKCSVVMSEDGSLDIQLREPHRGLAVGQYAVLYVSNICLGSAGISHVGPTEYDMQRTNELVYDDEPPANENTVCQNLNS